LVSEGIIDYIPFPDALVGKYQSFTEANISSLREVGYQEKFLDVEEGISHYLSERLN
jgi:ADP-L-glycero-D-manno-heptose 6-epimerase